MFANKSNENLGIKKDLSRLARFGANLSDAHSCFILLPGYIHKAIDGASSIADEELGLSGHHSLCSDILENHPLPPGHGLIGWVSKNHRSIHVSPFERDARTLGIYTEDEKLKSFIGIPIHLDFLDNAPKISGVIACDSKKAYAFSKLQGKLLEDLSLEVSNFVRLRSKISNLYGSSLTWEQFETRARHLIQSLGHDAIDILRLKPTNLSEIEAEEGFEAASSLYEQSLRLINQSMPPGIPLFQTPQGELLLLVDNMMRSFLVNKVAMLCNKASERSVGIKFSFSSQPLRFQKNDLSLSDALRRIGNSEEFYKDNVYEHRRA